MISNLEIRIWNFRPSPQEVACPGLAGVKFEIRNSQLGIRNAAHPPGTRDACANKGFRIIFVGQPSRLPGGWPGNPKFAIRNSKYELDCD